MRRVDGEIVLDQETAKAIELSLREVGAYVATVGMDRPLSAYTREEAIGLIQVAVESYQQHMQKIVLNDLKDEELPF